MVNKIKYQKMSNLNDQATTILLGSLKEIISNRKYVYVSGANYSYSRLEEPGKEMVINLVQLVLPLLAEARDLQLKEEAEKLMLDKLSK
jgi:hypothetical protein